MSHDFIGLYFFPSIIYFTAQKVVVYVALSVILIIFVMPWAFYGHTTELLANYFIGFICTDMKRRKKIFYTAHGFLI